MNRLEDIVGQYRDMPYSIRYIEHEVLGAYYDVRLHIGNKIAQKRTFTLAAARTALSELIEQWEIDEND